jgi:putative peptidoglycan lipid II flippase
MASRAGAAAPQRRGAALFRSTLVVAAIRGIDFGLSFLVSVLLAGRFGAGAQLDAFFLARRTTVGFADMIRKFVVQVVMPSVVARVDRGHPLSVHGLPKRMYVFVAVFAALTLAGMLIPSRLVDIFAPGFKGVRHDLTATMMAIMMPLLPLAVIGSLLVAVLQANRRYWVSEGNNIVQRGMLVLVLAIAVPPLGIVAGAWTMLIAGVVGFAILVAGSWSIIRRHPSALLNSRKVETIPDAQGDVPCLGGGVAAALVLNLYLQATSLLDFAVASLVPEGGVAALEYGSRLVSLVPGLLMSSLSTVMLPELIRAMQAPERERGVLVRFQRMVIFAQMPVSIGMMLGANLMVHILFGRGAFGEDSIQLAAATTAGYALAQLFLAPMTVLTSAIYADPRKSCLRDLATVAVGGLAFRAVAIGYGASVAGAGGIAWGAAVATCATGILTAIIARRRFHDLSFAGFGREVARIALCGGLAAGCGCLMLEMAPRFDNPLVKLAKLLVLGAVIVLVYGGAALALKLPEVGRLRSVAGAALAKRRGR